MFKTIFHFFSFTTFHRSTLNNLPCNQIPIHKIILCECYDRCELILAANL